jgi:hypothetical protein
VKIPEPTLAYHGHYRTRDTATLAYHGHYRTRDTAGSHSGVFEVVCLLGYDAM